MTDTCYIDENKLNSHNFIFDEDFDVKWSPAHLSRWFICNNCKLQIQVYMNSIETNQKNMNYSCDELIIKNIIQ